MDKLSLCFMVIISLPGVFLQENLSRKAFVFPQDSANSFVTLSAKGQEEPLKAFTVCLRIHTALTRAYSLFSYATKAHTNDILLFRNSPGVYSVSVGGADVYFNIAECKYEPMHFCTSWESSSGIVELWMNGKPMARTSLSKGYTLGEEPSIILGQEQDSYAGGFDINQSFVGDIGDVNMWDFVLSPAEVRAVYNGHTPAPNVLNWQNMKYEAQGEVFVKPQLWT